MSRTASRVGTAAGVALASAAAATAIGLAAQRRAARSIMRRTDPEAGEDFDQVFGHEVTVVTEDGVHLAVEVIEPSDPALTDITLVFTHGYALDRTTFHYQARDLRDVGRIVLWDQRGHGGSGVGDDHGYTIERLGRDLEEVIEATAPTGPVVLVGHSMGGMQIMQLAAARPGWFGERIVGVVLLATAATHGEGADLLIAGPLGQLAHRIGPSVASFLRPRRQVIDQGLRLADDLVVIITEHYGFGSHAPPSLVEHTKAMHAKISVDVLVAMLSVFNQLDMRVVFKPIQRAEVVIVAGESDRMAPVRLSRDLVKLMPGAELVTLADTGHMLMMERYAEVNQVVRDLLLRVRRGMSAT